MPVDQFSDGLAYEQMMGRWSRFLSREFLAWLKPEPQWSWLDIGCGTGALTSAILEIAEPSDILGIDPSQNYVAFARESIVNPRARFQVGDAQRLPLADSMVDCAVSGLVLNFLPEPDLAVLEMKRVTQPGGQVAAFVWDYRAGMQMQRIFWDAAVGLNPAAKSLDPGNRFPLCNPESLESLFARAGIQDVVSTALFVEMLFPDFDDYWQPFESGQGSSGGYAQTLSNDDRHLLRAAVNHALPIQDDGSIVLTSRAWGVHGSVPMC